MPGRWLSRVGEALLVLLAAAVPYLVVYRPWGGRWRIPVDASQDAGFHAMVVKTMVLRGGFRSTPDLGAPFGQHLSDFPLGGDHLHLLALRLLSLVEHDPFVVLNLYYAASFLLVAATAHVVLRALGLRPLLAAAGAVLFAYLPYHFWHHSARIFLSAYYAVPLAVLLAVWVAGDGIPWPRRFRNDSADRPEGDRRRMVAVVACVLVLGAASPYYAVFALVTIGSVGALSALRSHSFRPLVTATAVTMGIVLVLAANLSPDLLWRARQRPDDQVAVRTVAEVDRNGLRLTQMLLPSQYERLAPVVPAGPAARPTVPAEDSAYIGVFGAAGLILALAIALAGALGPFKLALPANVHALSTTALVAVLFGEVGGLGLLVAVLGFTETRTWSRIMLVAAFCAFATLGLCVQHLTHRATGRLATATLTVLVVGAVVGGLVDLIPVNSRPRYQATAREQRSTRELVARMEAALPDRAMVFELPVIDFPEAPHVADEIDYDLLKGYLAGTGRLRWSYGGVKGRASDWQRGWTNQPLVRMLDGLAAAGFQALYVDRFAYEDRAEALDEELRPITSGPVDESRDGRLRWYDLRPVEARLDRRLGPDRRADLGRAVTASPSYRFTSGSFPREVDPDGHRFQWVGGVAALEVSNPADRARSFRLSLTARGDHGGTLRANGGGLDADVPVSGEGTPLVIDVTLPPGVTRWSLTTDAPRANVRDARDLRVQLVDLDLTDPVIERDLPLLARP